MTPVTANGFAESFLHVDMDAFFVEVERLDDPGLRGRPVIVGGAGARGVVASASYEARAHGVRSAMPMVEARRRCPAAVVVPPRHRRYGEVSAEVFEIFRSFTPLVEGLSVDEAFLDISGLRLHFRRPLDVADAIRASIRATLDLPASVGVAAVKFVAKLASEDAKPDGVRVVGAGDELAYLHPMPVRRLWGVGQATHAALEALGVATIGDLAALPPGTLERRVGPAVGRHLSALASARDDRSIEAHGDAKSISAESTYERDLHDEEAIERAVLRHCDHLAARLRRAGVAGRTVSLKLRFADFTTVSRSFTSPVPVAVTADLWDIAQDLLARIERDNRGVRLLGVGATGLVPASEPHQLSMDHPGRDAVAAAAEEIRARFGDDAVLPARLVDRPEAAEEGD